MVIAETLVPAHRGCGRFRRSECRHRLNAARLVAGFGGLLPDHRRRWPMRFAARGGIPAVGAPSIRR